MGQMLGCSPVCCGRPQSCLGRVSASLLLPQTVQGRLQHRLPRPCERGSCAPGAASLQSESLQGDKTHFSGDMGAGWQPQLRASCHREKPSREPTPCVWPKLIFAVAGGTMAQPGQLGCPSLPYHSCVRLRHGAGPTAPCPEGTRTAMVKHVCSTAQPFGIPQQQGPRRCWATTGQAQGCRCGLPGPTPCHAGALQHWGRLYARLLFLSGAFPKGYGLRLSPLPKRCPPLH